MGGNSSSNDTSAGKNLAQLFATNQAAPEVAVAHLTQPVASSLPSAGFDFGSLPSINTSPANNAISIPPAYTSPPAAPSQEYTLAPNPPAPTAPIFAGRTPTSTTISGGGDTGPISRPYAKPAPVSKQQQYRLAPSYPKSNAQVLAALINNRHGGR